MDADESVPSFLCFTLTFQQLDFLRYRNEREEYNDELVLRFVSSLSAGEAMRSNVEYRAASS